MKITVTEAELRALLEFASKYSDRPNLHGVCASEGRLGATNGHALAILGEDPGATWVGRHVIPYAAVLAVSVRVGAECDDNDEDEPDSVDIEIDADAGTYAMSRGLVVVSGPMTPVKFPQVGEVVSIPRNPPSEKSFFDPGLVAKLTKINESRDGRFWFLSAGAPDEPLVFTADRWTVLVMPGKQ